MSMRGGLSAAERPAPRRLVLAGVCLAVAGLLAAGAYGLHRQARPAPDVWTGLPADSPLAAEKTLGINTDLARLDSAGREQALAVMEAAGLEWLRQRFAWDEIEPQRGRYDWTIADQIVDDAVRHHVKLVAVLDGSPRWARADVDASSSLAPPSEARDYGAFVAAFAGRYASRIDYYQVWDEPNIAPHWGAREIDPAAYNRLLREAALQLRTSDPGAAVLLAALAPNVEPGGANMSELQFLEALYNAGAAEWFDVAAAQLYPFEDAPGAPPDAAHLNWKRVALLRRVMEAHGDQGTAIWAVRFGWPASQLAGMAAAVTQARQDWPWLGPALWAAWLPADLHGEYALFEEAGRPGPGYDALAALARQPATAWPGVYPADHASGHKEGNWRVAGGAADIGASGDRLVIPFWGSRIDLDVRRGDYRAFLFITIDGGAANALPRDEAGRSYVVLYDPLHAKDRVTLAEGLGVGPHTAEIVAERGWGQWAIAGWAVAREAPGRARTGAIAVALLAIVPLALAAGQLWPERKWLAASADRAMVRYRALDERVALAITAAAVLMLLAAQSTVLSLLALGVLGLALVLRPETALPLIALCLPFYQPRKPISGKIFSVVEILTVLGVLAWVANRVLSALTRSITAGQKLLGRITGPVSWFARRASRLSSLDWAVVALVVWSGLSVLWAVHGREAAREFRTVVLEAGLFYALLRGMLSSRRGAWRVVDAWVLGAAAAAAIGIGQWAFGQNVITADGVWRVRGFYGSPNNLALYLGRGLPLVLAIGAFWRRTEPPWRRWAYAAAALVMAAAVFLTYSRGAWLIGVPAALLFLAAFRGRRTFAATVGLVVIVVVGAVLIAGVGRLTSLLDSSQGTTFFRLQLWRSSLLMVRDHPLLGVGLDNFLYAYRTHYVLPTAWEEFNLSHPHNLVLDFWLSLGLPGLALLGWLLLSFFRQGWRIYQRTTPGSEDQGLMLGVMAGAVYMIAHGLVDISFFLVDLAFVFMLMAALVQGSFWAAARPAAAGYASALTATTRGV